MPTTINTAADPWENVFNAVPGTRCQVKLPDVGARSPFAAVKQLVMKELVPLINETLLGLSDMEVTRPAILLSKKTPAEHAITQGPHRDWPTRRLKNALKKHDGFPVGVLLSLHNGGVLHLWPGSFDAEEVREQDRISVKLQARDIVMFHGAIVHEGAGYQGAVGEHHLRLHFYTQSARGINPWPISNETEHVRTI
ncbi:hypothetical protein JKP88DRAFT_268090 [Tribonema minus]|uniref:Phytanoyl-CoA dioxygenase n=1 Tax=Tribonema minus TaxID=303371 RepID=A0A836CHB8_9STRA|nr:hypothetical protein JKP88DRAFT_268090 [Tribonema minus]